jgi:serine/threonine protein kinase
LSKAYSNKALPAGTVIREWRLEDVLGVGGFGIVYKGRGIYFGELVAIKEYFPSSISERDAEDTVVPIGSDVEEVHALGLKKFVEEAKLLWNLSTPTRHPNIVSVRSLFEVHGTAYMVMDFEDGVSLSRLLKEGRRFNERSLWNIIKPIAEGLDRAHRVGVLHRDIKPPNILITDDNRPVLIDFGSARFEAAEATSTSVTFHTPPYAAVEQYVKTYPQGPWTDIYALSVVLYECVTGEKPPEVLERMHGGLGTALAEGHWPGFTKRFLQAIDAGMTIKPSERPQSIREWLALFGKKDVDPELSGDDEPTRFFAHEVKSEAIVPVAPTAPGIDKKDLDTGVPEDPSEVQFKRAGEETGSSRKKKQNAEADETAKPVEAEIEATPPPVKPEPVAELRKPAPAPVRASESANKWYKDPRKAMLAGGGAVALIAAVAAGSIMFGGSTDSGTPLEIPDLNAVEAGSIPIEGLGQLIGAERTLANDACTAGASATAVNDLVAAGEQLDKQLAALQPLADDPAQAGAATTRVDEMKRTATAANVAFANALLRDAEARIQAIPADVRTAALQGSLAALRSTVQASGSLTDPVQSLGSARDALAKSQSFAAALSDSYRTLAATKRPTQTLPQAPKATVATATTNAATPSVAPAAVAPATSSPSTSAAKVAQINSIVASGRSMAKQVMKSGNKENAALARNYDKYLANVADSARGARTDRELDQLIKQANQTKAYIVFLNRQPAQ